MKLAGALALRADAQKRLAQLQSRTVSSARYQEGEEPIERSTELLADARATTDEIESLIRRINRTNAATELEPGLTVTDAVARRDVLALRRKLVTSVADAASGRVSEGPNIRVFVERQMRSELRLRGSRRPGPPVPRAGRPPPGGQLVDRARACPASHGASAARWR
jgi:hypothetical protein